MAKESPNRYCTLYIVRHGETEYNVKKLLQGHSDSPLTENGQNQARLLRKKFKKIHFDAVYSSDLLRARRTAELVTLERKIAIKTSQALRERAFGQFEGKPWTETDQLLEQMLQKLEGLTDQERFRRSVHPDIETDEKLAGRQITYLREIAVAHNDETVLVVSHGGAMRALLIHLGVSTYSQLQHGAINNGASVKLRADGVDFFVDEMSGINI